MRKGYNKSKAIHRLEVEKMESLIGRKQELALLENMYRRKNAFIMVDGRHKTGKTALIRTFLEGKRALYFSAKPEVDIQNRRQITRSMSHYFHDAFNKSGAIVPQWKEIFRTFAEREESSRKVLVIDNFDTLMQSEPSFDKLLKQVWDTNLKKADVMLIIILSDGSILKTMETKKSALLNTISLRIRLKPLTFIDMLIDYPKYDFDQVMTLYAIAGGTPRYWTFFNGCMSTMEYMNAVKRVMMTPTGYLYNEPANLLEQDVWEPSPYNSILKTIADGYHQPKDIMRILDMRSSELTHCIDNLITLGYVETRIPITEKKSNVKKACYYFADPMMEFWYTFIYPFRDQLETGNTLQAFENLKIEFPNYIQHWFESAAREILKAATQQEESDIPFQPNQIGTFWNRDGDVINVVAVDEKHKKLFMADTVYRNRPYTLDELNNFKENCQSIREFRSYKDYQKIYGVFAASPFEKELMDYTAITDNVILFDGVTVYHQ